MLKPNSNARMDKESFDILKRTIRNISIANRGKTADGAFATKLPVMVGMKLTNKCNLRCRHCYEWSDSGYHWKMNDHERNDELDYDVVSKIMAQTQEVNSALYLWGGEPLLYSHLKKLASLLERDNRITALCTNGIFIEENMDSILKMGAKLELVIALEGLEADNDSIRGKGTYGRVLNAIDKLVELRKRNIFHGKITVHTVINEKNYDKLYDYVEAMEQLKIDSLLLCFPWYISQALAEEMDIYFNREFDWLKDNKKAEGSYTWHFFKYGLNHACSGKIFEELNRILQKSWNIRVRYFPSLNYDEICNLLEGKHVYVHNRTKCNAHSLRMDVLTDGSVSSCKHFPEFTVGNLKDSSVYEIWNSEKFNMIRRKVAGELMPICSQCNNLYLHGE